MKVELIKYTDSPDNICAFAASNCVRKSLNRDDLDSMNYSALRSALKSGHDSVAEHAIFTFLISDVSRITETQLVRHRMASYAIQSGRYCTRTPTLTIMPETVNAVMDEDLEKMISDCEYIIGAIDAKLESKGVPKEDRRYFYPQGLSTRIVVTMNGRELRHFLSLRMCNRAQWEIKHMARAMYEEVKKVAPVLMEEAGPGCMTGNCKEGRPCDNPYINEIGGI